MNNNKLYLALLIALILAGTASILVSQRLSQVDAKAPAASIVVASKDLDIGSALVPEDLKVIAWNGTVPKGAYTTVGDAAGRAVLYPMFENEAILDAKLAPMGSGAGLPAVIPPGMRAVSIRVDEVVAVAGFVGPGTRVDVLLTGESGNGSESRTKAILENIQVLAAGQKIQPDAQGKAEKVNVVTLLCSTQDAAKVTLAANEGRIQLLLRNPMDAVMGDQLASIGKASLYGDGSPKPAPAPRPVRAAARPVVNPPAPPPAPVPVIQVVAAPPPPPTVIVIRGDHVSTIEVRTSDGKPSNEIVKK
ncbi:MAG: Flp pilus assembly protein CpaB [Bryobacteraceae bacterium]